MTERILTHYKVFEEISRGGMGVVYRAVDMKLDREVAIKVLPPELVADPERKRRFVQEAKAAAALHHPHIATIFEIDEAEDTTFIAMELIRGKKLGELFDTGRLSLSRILELATEIAEGLARAHEKGIVHRDLKPGNIMLTEDEHVKIIDFGLAKLIEPMGSADSLEDTALRQTESGKILGTVSYMSPEQATGKRLDHRSDIFSFGIVLYEMIAGKLPFQGPSGVETLNAILKDPTPPLSADVPGQEAALFSELERVVRRCLAKDPEERYQTTKDLLSELKRLRRDSDTAVSAPVAPVRSVGGKALWIGGALAAAAIAAVIYLARPREASVPRLANPVQVTSAQGAELYPAWSPDGRTLAYSSSVRGVGNWDVWVTQIGGAQPVNRTSDFDLNDYYPSWSPDGTEIVFASQRDGGGYYIMSALGGAARRVLASNNMAPTGMSRPQFSADGTRLAGITYEGDTSGIEILTLQTRESERIPLALDVAGPADLAWSPDERLFTFVEAVDFTAEVTQIWLVRASDGAMLPVTDGTSLDWSPSWSRDARRLFYVSNREGSMDLWQQRIGPDGERQGEPERITTGVGMRSASFSPDGSKLAYTRGRGRVSNVWRVRISPVGVATWSDAEQLTFDEAFIEFLDVSPDGERLVLSSDRSGNQDLWLLPSKGGDMIQLTDDPTPDWRPSWSPDGNEIAFYAYRSGNREIWTMPLDGGTPRQLTTDDAPDLHPFWSPDGTHIVFASPRSGGRFGIWTVPSEGGEPRAVAENGNLPAWSPDGKWIAYRDGIPEGPRIFRAPVEGGEAELLTHGFSVGQPRWSPDGNELYFLAGGDRGDNIWSVSVTDGSERALTDFTGRPGGPGVYALATYGEYLYFTWENDVGDLWVMDVVEE